MAYIEVIPDDEWTGELAALYPQVVDPTYKRVDNIKAAIEIMTTAVRIDTQSAICHYNLACYYALARQPAPCTQHLGIALDINPEYRKNADSEPDFDLLRDDPGFRSILSVAV